MPFPTPSHVKALEKLIASDARTEKLAEHLPDHFTSL